MKKLLPYLSLLGIAFFILLLFPFGRNFFLDLLMAADEKKNNVVEEYQRVKDVVVGVNDSIEDTQTQVTDTLNKINETKESIEETAKTMNEFYESSQAKMDAIKEKTGLESWRQSDPAQDISISAGRINYNFADPGPDGLAKEHLELDLRPWIEWGSTSEDETTKEERIKILSVTEYGRKVLDELGYDY